MPMCKMDTLAVAARMAASNSATSALGILIWKSSKYLRPTCRAARRTHDQSMAACGTSDERDQLSAGLQALAQHLLTCVEVSAQPHIV